MAWVKEAGDILTSFIAPKVTAIDERLKVVEKHCEHLLQFQSQQMAMDKDRFKDLKADLEKLLGYALHGIDQRVGRLERNEDQRRLT